MPKEILSKNGQPANLDSPLGIEQESFFSAKNGFPQNKEEFRNYLKTLSPWQRFFEVGMALVDVQRAFIEWQSLLRSPVYQGREVPSGDGSTVVIVPGFGTFEWQYYNTAVCLTRANYKVKIYPLRLGVNIEPIEHMLERYISYLTEEKKDSSKKIGVIGHSKGGLLTAAAYVTYPKEFLDSVDRVFFVGAPVPWWVNSAVGEAYLFFQNRFDGDDFKLSHKFEELENLINRKNLKVTSIGSIKDPILQGRPISQPEDYHEVRGSHSGLLVNPEVLKIIGVRLNGHLATGV